MLSNRRPSSTANAPRSLLPCPSTNRREVVMSPAEGFAHPELLIETEALERSLGEPGLRIFDCTTNLIPDPKTTYQAVPARADFEKGHIPGTQFIDLQADLSDSSHRFRFMLPGAEAFAAAMSRFGAGEGTRVVLYSTANPWW